MLCHGSEQTNLIASQLSRRFAVEGNGAENARLSFNRQHAKKRSLAFCVARLVLNAPYRGSVSMFSNIIGSPDSTTRPMTP
jgi:hypothetical protein